MSIQVDSSKTTKYPRPTVAGNIVPSMHTPGKTFPWFVHKIQIGEDSLPVLEDGKIIVLETVVERFKPPKKKTSCGLRGKYVQTWHDSICHAIMAYFYGFGSVTGRVYATTFALNYRRKELQLSQLFDSDMWLLVDFSTGRGSPATLDAEHSSWVVSIGQLRDYALSIAAGVSLVDSLTTQDAKIIESQAVEPELVQFEL